MDNLFTITRKDNKDNGVIIWTDVQKRYILEQYQKHGNSNIIAAQFNTSGAAIRRLLRKEHIEIVNHRKHLPRNSDYFEIIDSVEKAYWLGIMYSDGYVIEDHYTVGLCLIDKEHIEKFLRALDAQQHTITEYLPSNSSQKNYSVSIRDKKLFDDLNNLNVIPRKSTKEIPFPNFSNNKLTDSFIRGYFDGDGSLSFSIQKNNFKISFVGNKTFLEGLRHYLDKDKVSLIKEKRSDITYAFSLSGRKQVVKILNQLYTDSIDETRLNRKYIKYRELLNCLGLTSLNSEI